jgi:hypothetical protein
MWKALSTGHDSSLDMAEAEGCTRFQLVTLMTWYHLLRQGHSKRTNTGKENELSFGQAEFAKHI